MKNAPVSRRKILRVTVLAAAAGAVIAASPAAAATTVECAADIMGAR